MERRVTELETSQRAERVREVAWEPERDLTEKGRAQRPLVARGGPGGERAGTSSLPAAREKLLPTWPKSVP